MVALSVLNLWGRELTVKSPQTQVVYLLPHSHVDIGYTHVQTDVEQAQWRYLETGMDLARKSAANPAGARFKWNVEVLWAVDSYLKQASPEKRHTGPRRRSALTFMHSMSPGRTGRRKRAFSMVIK